MIILTNVSTVKMAGVEMTRPEDVLKTNLNNLNTHTKK